MFSSTEPKFRSTCHSVSSAELLSTGPRLEIRRHTEADPWTYLRLDQHQRKLALEVQSGAPGAYLLSEVAPVITQGRRTAPQDILLPKEVLAAEGIDLVTVDRGGFATYHGPGQWLVFPVVSLETWTGDPRGVRRAVEMLLEIAQRVGRIHHPDFGGPEIRWGKDQGVWTRRGKFAAVGIHVQAGVILHGLSINGYRTRTSFRGLRPCGLDEPVDFLLNEGEASESKFLELGRIIQKEILKIRS